LCLRRLHVSPFAVPESLANVGVGGVSDNVRISTLGARLYVSEHTVIVFILSNRDGLIRHILTIRVTKFGAMP
jgi:hypothetical protein